MPANALTPETSAARAPARVESTPADPPSLRSAAVSSSIDLDEFAATWERRSASEERDRQGVPRAVEGEESEVPSGPAPQPTEHSTTALPSVSEETVASWTLREFGGSGLAVKVDSSLLDDTIWLLSEAEYDDGSTMEAQELDTAAEDDLPVYRSSELEGLVGLRERSLRDLHRLKRAFGVRFESVTRQEDARDRLNGNPEEVPLDWLNPPPRNRRSRK